MVAKFYSDNTLNYLVVVGVGSSVHWAFDIKFNFGVPQRKYTFGV